MTEFVAGVIVGLLAGAGINFCVAFYQAWKKDEQMA